MSNRISINFVCGYNYHDKSATLFSHTDGESLLQMLMVYLYKLYEETKGIEFSPLDRKEPGTVFADFVRFLFAKLPKISSNYYIVPSPRDGDNYEHGHYYVILDRNIFTITKKLPKGGKL